ncbi:GNAT family N-acetyltransferase [Paenibacillus sp. JNUCC31]|uniref:GNAT family N-acetyltransferase n=1 Tax=Paenibacillus sp. JNUCC-31 TaxID=2777983 RepID=UPI001784F093|nr:N-acetyltransferase [Paenibacillus sp. JNUCC-31]QOS79200.1 GNAT family N-acetyltransferase [Paenibacillus sp. JNUCC-31]
MTTISIDKASSYSLLGAKLHVMAIGNMAHTIAGSNNQNVVDATFRKLWQTKNNRFSHQYAYEAKLGEKIYGMISCLPITVLDQLTGSTMKQLFLLRKMGLVLYNLVRPMGLFSTLTLKEGFQGEFHIASLATMPESRGMGIGSQLIHFAEEEAISRGYAISSLTVKKENHLAARLYAKLGYEITSEINKPTMSFYRMVKKLK